MSNESLYNKGLFSDWVPKLVMLLLIILFIIPIMTVSGVYTNNISDLAGHFGSYTEHIQYASNAVTIGMSLALAIVMRVKMRFRSKEIIVGTSLMIAGLLGICATTSNVYLYIGANLLIGFLKMFALLEMVIPVMFMLSPSGEKNRFYSLFYQVAIGAGTFTGYISSIYIHNYNVPNAIYLCIIVMLGIALLGTIFMHNKRFCRKVPLYQIDWVSILFVGIFLMTLNYGVTFMKQQNWLNSPSIRWSLIISILSISYVVFRQAHLRKKTYYLSAFVKLSSVRFGVLLLVFQAMYLSVSSVYMQWTMGALGHDALTSARLNLWTIPGLVIGSIFGVVGFKKKWHIKFYILMGFVAFFINTLLTYLTIQPNMNIEMLYFPMVFKGIGMVILFIAVWYYVTVDLTMPDGLGVISLLMVFRTFVSLGITGAITAYLSTQFQMQSMADMSNYWDVNLMGAAAMQGYGSMTLSSLLASGKTLLGWFCWFIIPVAILVLSHDYGRANNRHRVIVKRLINGKNIKGYKGTAIFGG